MSIEIGHAVMDEHLDHEPSEAEDTRNVHRGEPRNDDILRVSSATVAGPQEEGKDYDGCTEEDEERRHPRYSFKTIHVQCPIAHRRPDSV